MSQIKWGYTEFGKHMIVKLKVTLAPCEKEKLRDYYHVLAFLKAKKDNSWIIQGCLFGDTYGYSTFKSDLKSALLQTKISLLQNELQAHEEVNLEDYISLKDI